MYGLSYTTCCVPCGRSNRAYLEDEGVCFMSMSLRLPVLYECIGVIEWMGESPLMSEFASLSLDVLRRFNLGLGVCRLI